MTVPQPIGLDGWVALAEAAVADRERLAWVQRDPATGEVVGTTSYYGVNEATESLVIGWTMVARPWWRTAVNTETKLLLLTRAFEELGRRARGVPGGRAQRAVAAGGRTARCHPGRRAAAAQEARRWDLARLGHLLDHRRRVANRTEWPGQPARNA